MKKITLTLSALIIAGMMLFSCGKGGGDAAIKDAANGFITAMNKMDMQGARKFATDSSKIMIDQILEKMKTMSENDKKFIDEQKAKAEKITVTIKEVKANGDNAVATFSGSDEPTKLDSIRLKKQKGEWLVDMTKM